MRSLLITLILFSLITTFPLLPLAKDNIANDNDLNDVILVLLNPYAKKAIVEKYPDRSFSLWNAEIIEIKRLSSSFSQYDFKIKVKYDTYTGAHNPPEGPVYLSFLVTIEGVNVVEITD